MKQNIKKATLSLIVGFLCQLSFAQNFSFEVTTTGGPQVLNSSFNSPPIHRGSMTLLGQFCEGDEITIKNLSTSNGLPVFANPTNINWDVAWGKWYDGANGFTPVTGFLNGLATNSWKLASVRDLNSNNRLMSGATWPHGSEIKVKIPTDGASIYDLVHIPGGFYRAYTLMIAPKGIPYFNNGYASSTTNCVNSMRIIIYVKTTPLKEFKNLSGCTGESYLVPLNSNYNYSNWTPILQTNNPTPVNTTTIIPTATTTYSGTVTNAAGCSITDEFTISVDATCKEQKCMMFDGKNDYLTSQTDALNNINTGDFTFEAIINGFDYKQENHPMIFSNGAVSVFFHNVWNQSVAKMLCIKIGGANYFIYNNGTFNANILDGRCHHIAISKKNHVLRFYIDGKFIGRRIMSTNPNIASNYNTIIGKYQSDAFPYNHNNDYFFEGSIAQVRVWDVARTEAQIATYSQLRIPNQTGLTAYFELTDGNPLYTDNKVDNYDAQLGSTANADVNDPQWTKGCCHRESNSPSILKSDSYSDLNTEHALSHEEFSSQNITIYPNPNKGTFEVSLEGIEEEVTIEIYNSLGKVIESKQTLQGQNLKFNLSQYKKGIYLIKVVTGEKVISKRVIIE